MNRRTAGGVVAGIALIFVSFWLFQSEEEVVAYWLLIVATTGAIGLALASRGRAAALALVCTLALGVAGAVLFVHLLPGG